MPHAPNHRRYRPDTLRRLDLNPAGVFLAFPDMERASMIWVIEVRNGCKGWMMTALREPVRTREQARISLAAIKRDYPALEFRIRKYVRQEP